MKIYTKTGDEGMTSLFGGKRLPKNDVRIEAYGTVDELNAWIGLVRDEIGEDHHVFVLKEIQDRLFTIGAHLATAPSAEMPVPDLIEMDTLLLENEIDQITVRLPPLKHFILPGGHRLVSETHLARTVCRRAERRVMSLHITHAVDPLILIYLNRLSDYLFVLSRWIAQHKGIEEIRWIPRH